MRRQYEPIGELDLYAYADGLLEGDAIRRAEIERYLASDAEAAALVAEIRAQNREIREAYGDVVARPVPDRLIAALEQGKGRRGRHLVGATAAAVLLTVAAGGGWLAGQLGDEDQWALEAFARRAAIQHHLGSSAGAQPSETPPITASTEPLAWLNQRIALEIKAPDLGAEGFELIDKSTVGPADDRIVQLVYRNAEGVLLNLFLRPRWEERSSTIDVMRSDDVDVHYWLDGPLAFALTSNAQETDTKRLAQAVHEAVERSRLADPSPEPILSEGVPELRGFGIEASGMSTTPSIPTPLESRPAGEPQLN